MARVKRGTVSRRKHNKLLKLNKGYRGTKSRLIRAGHEAELHARQYAFHGRKLRKRNIRSLWITRIGEAVKAEGISYSVFINYLNKADIKIDRKILTKLIIEDPKTFKEIVQTAKSAA